MRIINTLLLIAAVISCCIEAQVIFGGAGSKDKTDSSAGDNQQVNERLGLLGQQLGLSPTGEGEEESGALVRDPNPRVPQGGELNSQCCCVPRSTSCEFAFGRENQDLVGLGLIDPRKPGTAGDDINNRIANFPGSGNPEPVATCPTGTRSCCYNTNQVDISAFSRTCIQPEVPRVDWRQGCRENNFPNNNRIQCGRRRFRPASNLEHGQASQGEFPFTCLLLNQNYDYIGTCALIPSGSHNDNNRGRVKVITAAHRLKALQEYDELIVRVGEYDASGNSEVQEHQEYTVERILKHPEMSTKRLSNDLAILYTVEPIVLNTQVNTACLPSCHDQFSYRFNNGTGTRCWVAGWGKDRDNGQFQFIQRKVDVPLVDDNTCERGLKIALNNNKPGQNQGNAFRLHSSEICAGGEPGKDACQGDGGSPLVCQAQSGRWTVVGLVAWGIGCATHTPGVYAKISHFQNWIDRN